MSMLLPSAPVINSSRLALSSFYRAGSASWSSLCYTLPRRVVTSKPFTRPLVTMASLVHRVTMFKLPKTEDQHALLEQYKKLKAENSKDGKPYILNLAAGPAEEDPRSQGFTFVSKTEFASMDDMKYYDDQCPHHQALKNFAKTLTVEGIMTVYFKPQITGSSL